MLVARIVGKPDTPVVRFSTRVQGFGHLDGIRTHYRQSHRLLLYPMSYQMVDAEISLYMPGWERIALMAKSTMIHQADHASGHRSRHGEREML